MLLLMLLLLVGVVIVMVLLVVVVVVVAVVLYCRVMTEVEPPGGVNLGLRLLGDSTCKNRTQTSLCFSNIKILREAMWWRKKAGRDKIVEEGSLCQAGRQAAIMGRRTGRRKEVYVRQ